MDYKDGKITWDNSDNWERPEEDYAYNQDILQVEYGKCLIDVGGYSSKDNVVLTIMVLDLTRCVSPDDFTEQWGRPFARIPCTSKQDLLLQLQRAVEVYPALINKLAREYETCV